METTSTVHDCPRSPLARSSRRTDRAVTVHARSWTVAVDSRKAALTCTNTTVHATTVHEAPPRGAFPQVNPHFPTTVHCPPPTGGLRQETGAPEGAGAR